MMRSRKKSLSARHLQQLSREIDPDEIFLDATNLPHFDTHQFEGRIEKPIGRHVLVGVALAFFLIQGIFLAKVVSLQVVHGSELFAKSEHNRLEESPIFALRGVIYDRNNVPLVWNARASDGEVHATSSVTEFTKDAEDGLFPKRVYTGMPGFGHILGYVRYPKKDSQGNYYQSYFEGLDGIEEHYNDLLSGVNGKRIIETDALGRMQSGNIIDDPKHGEHITLSVDAKVQEQLYTAIQGVVDGHGYRAGAGVLMDVQNGEVVALTSYPDYQSNVLSEGSDKKTIQGYQLDKRSVFLDRAVSGLYTPGSIIKPIMAAAALNEGIIVPEREILSTGSISIQNPYDPTKTTVFNDWKIHGWTDMRKAIAVSSDVYFYTIGGGFEQQRGIGIANIEKYARMFGLGAPSGIDLGDEKSGTVPNPEWKAKLFKGEPWRLGDTYHTVIGQYGFQVTGVQAVRAIAAIASGGKLNTPHLILRPEKIFPVQTIPIPPQHLAVVREGMRQAVQEGTVTGLNVPYVKVAGKTGTAEIDAGKKYINSWVVGFFPYDKPRYAFAVVMERGPYENDIGGVYVMRQVLDWMHTSAPGYLE